jgi:large subunit ribosomal protein L15
MVVNKRSKNSRHRGTWTHGWGEKKKHRHAGSRGGRGNAGSGKRADQNKPSIETNKQYFGKFGFVRHGVESKVKTINVGLIQEILATLEGQKIAVKQANGYAVDLTKTDFNKLLGGGDVTVSLHITVDQAVDTAVEKVQAAGGSVKILSPKEEESADEPAKE